MTQQLSGHCLNELRDAVQRNQFRERDCLNFAKQISVSLQRKVKKKIDEEGFSSLTVDYLMDTWQQRNPNEACLNKVKDILSSINKHELAEEIEKGQNEGRDDDNNTNRFGRGGDLRRSKKILQKTQQKEVEARKAEENTWRLKKK